jgi:hypothetical protein
MNRLLGTLAIILVAPFLMAPTPIFPGGGGSASDLTVSGDTTVAGTLTVGDGGVGKNGISMFCTGGATDNDKDNIVAAGSNESAVACQAWDDRLYGVGGLLSSGETKLTLLEHAEVKCWAVFDSAVADGTYWARSRPGSNSVLISSNGNDPTSSNGWLGSHPFHEEGSYDLVGFSWFNALDMALGAGDTVVVTMETIHTGAPGGNVDGYAFTWTPANDGVSTDQQYVPVISETEIDEPWAVVAKLVQTTGTTVTYGLQFCGHFAFRGQ